MTRTLTLASLAAALIVPLAHAQQPPPATAPRPAGTQPARAIQGAPAASANQSAVNDSLFVSAAGTGGQAELSIAELGMQRAKDPELKKLSQKFLDEHQKMNADLTNLATQKRLGVPRGVDARAAFCSQSLAGLSGEEFDRCYAKAQCVMHEDAVAAFEAEAKRGQDPDIKAWASKNLPHIKEHLKDIKPIAERLCKDEDKDHDKNNKDSKDDNDRSRNDRSNK
jgi:putative membrane protein